MEAHDIDVLVLGRQANVRYVTGAPQLWMAGRGRSARLRDGARDRRDQPAEHLGRGRSRGDPAREPLRHGLESDETIAVLKSIDG